MLADQVQTQVQARCHSCRRQNGALVNEQHGGVDVDVGIPPRQLAGELPMGGGTPAVEQAGSSQREGPDAHRRDPGTVVGGGSQCRNCLRVRLFQELVRSRHHHEVRFREGIHPVGRANFDHAPIRCRADRRPLPAHANLIFRRAAVGVRGSGLGCCQIGHAEDLAGNHQFETHDLVKRQHTDDHG